MSPVTSCCVKRPTSSVPCTSPFDVFSSSLRSLSIRALLPRKLYSTRCRDQQDWAKGLQTVWSLRSRPRFQSASWGLLKQAEMTQLCMPVCISWQHLATVLQASLIWQTPSFDVASRMSTILINSPKRWYRIMPVPGPQQAPTSSKESKGKSDWELNPRCHLHIHHDAHLSSWKP